MSTGNPSMPLRPGDPARVGAYRLLGRLGQGGQGVVYLGEDPRGYNVAVKVLKIEIRDDTKAKARFVREIAAARKVAPFCTARILAFDIEGELPFVASEFISGPTLEQRVARYGPIAGTDLDRLAIGTAAALAAIHEASVVHCDLKPANVVLGPDWPRVIDFGIARAIDGTGTQTIMGSPAYMSPERYLNDSVGAAADVFSWAATIAYAASGRAPFGHDGSLAIMRRVIDQPPVLSNLAPQMDELLRQCLHKDPDDRPAATEVLLRLVAKSQLKLEPAARRTIGELSTRIIPKQAVRDIEERRRAAGRPDVEFQPGPARPGSPHPASGQSGSGQSASGQSGLGQSASGQSGSGGAHSVPDGPPRVPAQRDGSPPVQPVPDERTLKLSGGRGQTRKILPRPEPTSHLADAADLTAEAPPGASPADSGDAGWWNRARRDTTAIALAVVLGLLGAVAWYLYDHSAPVAAGVGVTVLVVAYLVRVLAVSDSGHH
jgi:serine/threonine protein kinase